MFSFGSIAKLMIIVMLSLLLGCMKDSTTKSSPTNSPEVVNRLKANNITPATFASRSQSIITLSYTDLDNDLANSCTLSQLTNITVTQACSCDGMGVCNVGVMGVSAYSGPGSFSFSFTGGGKTSTTGKATFTISAPPPGSNVAPIISAITAKTTAEGSAITTIPFTISDEDSTVTCADVAATSSNTTLFPLANVVITGAVRTCNLSITPVSNTYGSSNIELTLTDKGTPLPAKTATASFTATVTGFNDPPIISAVSAQTTLEDTATSAIAFTISDVDSTLTCANVVGTSSNSTVISNSNIVIAGTAPNCTATVTPNLNQSGTSTITLTLNDNGMPMPAKTVTTTFVQTVTAVNDVPTLPAISNQTTDQNLAKSVAFTISDLESSVTCAGSVNITSSNTTLVPNSNVVISGTAPNCSMLITPANNQWGTTTMTVVLTDNGLPLPAETTTKTFTLTVNQANIAPVISAITAKSTNEDTATAGIAFTISDTDSTIFCTNVAGTSSNTTLVPNGNIVITGTAPNCIATVTPAANLSGTATITLTLTDNGTPMPARTAISAFLLTVNPVNDAPTISAITSKSADEDVASSAITFTIADIDSTVTCSGSVSAVSSNTTVIPNANIVISGSAPNCQAVITSAANKSGSATITLTLTDNGTPMPALTATSAFTMTIDAVPDLTGTLSVANNLSGVASAYSSNSYARKLRFSGLSSDEALTSVEVCLGTAAGACDVSSWVIGTGYTTSGTAPTVTLDGDYRMKSGIGGAQVFTLAASCSSTTNYYYSIRGTNSVSNISNIVSTPAWNFWEPSCLGGSKLTQWLDATEASTFTFSSGVSAWRDKSTKVMNLSQASTGLRPDYSAAEFGTDLPAVTFDGSQALERNSFIFAQGTASVFTVIKGIASNTTRYVISEGQDFSTSNYYSPLATTTNDIVTGRFYFNGISELNLPNTSSVLLDNTVRLAMTEDSGTTFQTYSNGIKQSQAAFAYDRGTPSLDTYVLGGRYRDGAIDGDFIGSIGEFIVTYGVLSATERQKLEGYSAHKWEVNGILNVAHPYSVTPP